MFVKVWVSQQYYINTKTAIFLQKNGGFHVPRASRRASDLVQYPQIKDKEIFYGKQMPELRWTC